LNLNEIVWAWNEAILPGNGETDYIWDEALEEAFIIKFGEAVFYHIKEALHYEGAAPDASARRAVWGSGRPHRCSRDWYRLTLKELSYIVTKLNNGGYQADWEAACRKDEALNPPKLGHKLRAHTLPN